MTTITKKELIIRKYIELTDTLKKHLGAQNDLFPQPYEIDVIDLIIFIEMFFETAGDYRSGIQTLMEMKKVSIDNATFEELYPHIEAFLVFLRELK